jgi:hypothetical protein
LECATLNVESFPYLTWDQLCDHAKTEHGKKEVATARSMAKSPGVEPSFLPSCVTHEDAAVIKISRSTIVMNATEYKNHFGKAPPGARGPKVPTLVVPREGSVGEFETVWLFADPSSPHRTQEHIATIINSYAC